MDAQNDDEVARGLRAFYRGMFAHRGGDRAIQEMNDAIRPGEMTFGALHAEQLFKKVYRQFHAELCTPEAIERRVDAMIPEWHAQARIDFGWDFTAAELQRARDLARQHLQNHDGNFAAADRQL